MEFSFEKNIQDKKKKVNVTWGFFEKIVEGFFGKTTEQPLLP
jgi:hypothetical protein